MSNKPNKLILDYSKWRCGEEGEYKVGKGKVALQNPEGYQCCLGQWCLQLGATEEEILKKGEPNEINTLIPFFVEEEIESAEELINGEFVRVEVGRYKHTNSLATECITINDNEETTPEEKLRYLQMILNSHGVQLEVINKPSDNK